jgi:peptidoglycan hydrolase CwlO-like protein
MIILETQDSSVELPSSKDILEKQQTKLAKQIQKIINNMSELKQGFPFNIVGKLADKAWVNTKVEEIQEQINQWQEKCEHYEALIKVLLVIKETRIN